mgnify:CR=1 FL=1
MSVLTLKGGLLSLGAGWRQWKPTLAYHEEGAGLAVGEPVLNPDPAFPVVVAFAAVQRAGSW